MFGDKAIEAGLKKFGHVQRRDSEDISRWTLRLELAGRRSRGGAGRIFLDAAKLAGVGVGWRAMIGCGASRRAGW